MKKHPLSFHWKYKDFELRASTKFLARFTIGEPNETIDFVYWKKDGTGRDYCFSLAYFERHKEGYDLKFVGDNPFKYISKEDLPFVWDALSEAQKVLNDFFAEFNEE